MPIFAENVIIVLTKLHSDLGRMILSGDEAGLVAISSPTTGMTVRVISDQQGAPICNIHAALAQVNMGGVRPFEIAGK